MSYYYRTLFSGIINDELTTKTMVKHAIMMFLSLYNNYKNCNSVKINESKLLKLCNAIVTAKLRPLMLYATTKLVAIIK